MKALVFPSCPCTIAVGGKEIFFFVTNLSHRRPSVDDHTLLLQES